MRKGLDRWLLVGVFALTLWGLVMVYSSSSALGVLVHGEDSEFFVERQVVKAGLGLALMMAISFIPTRLLRGRLAFLAWGGGLLVLGFLVVMRLWVGLDAGPIRWVLGGSFQPAEFARIALLMALAAALCRAAAFHRIKDFALPALLIVPVVGSVAIQPNLSMALVLGASGLAVLFLAGYSWQWLAGLCAGIGALGFLFRADYQVVRLRTYAESVTRMVSGQALAAPNEQVQQALIALGSGGIFGNGVGRGLQKFKFLAQPHTDFILAIHGEETGFVGVCALLALELFVIYRILRIGRRAHDPFGRYLCYGIAVQLGILVLLHAAVNFGVGPTTGVPLPFVSYGGSALVANLMGVGLALAVSRQDPGDAGRAPLDLGPSRWRTA